MSAVKSPRSVGVFVHLMMAFGLNYLFEDVSIVVSCGDKQVRGQTCSLSTIIMIMFPLCQVF